MKLITFFFISLALLTLSCEKQSPTSSKTTKGQTYVLKSSMCMSEYDFIAGQNYIAGKILVTNDVYNIYVTYTTSNGWMLNQTHLYVGNMAGLPVNNSGNPKIGHFPYASAHNGVTTYTYTIPIDPNEYCYKIAAHAEVSKMNKNGGGGVSNETAWSNGTNFTSNGWSMYSEYCLCPVN